MSRGGRGRGRGGRFVPPTEGLEKVTYQGNPLFPDWKLPEFRPASERETWMLDFDRRMMSQMRDSAFYLQAAPVRDDVERYTDKFKSWQKPKTKSLTSVEVDLALFPDELHQVSDPSRRPGAAKASTGGVDFNKLLKTLEEQENDQSKKGKAT
ncbi:hypothetical protein HK405_015074, partial [Cladochytrium tenue]